MKQLINKLFGVYATSKKVQGKKSQGSEDYSTSYGTHWRLDPNSNSWNSTN